MRDLLTQETIDFLAGSSAGALSIVVGQPFDTIKVKLQTSTQYSGPIECFKKIMSKEGPIGLFSGMAPPLIISTAVNAIIFTTYNYTLRILRKEEDGSGVGGGSGSGSSNKASISQMFIAGACGGLTQSIITSPGELIKIRLQTNSELKSTYQAMKRIIQTSGPFGLYRGFLTTIYREIPAFGSYFTTYYSLMDLMGDNFGEILPSFIAGGLAGAVSWAIVYPIDIAKTMIQMSETSTTSPYQVLKEQYHSHGLRSLYRGLGTTIVRSLPVNAVVFPVYEFVSSLLSDYVAEI